MAESFLSSMKKGRIKKRIDKTREIANAEIDEYIEMFYNRTRRHSHLNGVRKSPGSPKLCFAHSSGMRRLRKIRGQPG